MSTATQFEPIADPLSLSPEEFVARSRERGIRFVRGYTWHPAKRCGCYLGVACVMKHPGEGLEHLSYELAAIRLDISDEEAIGAIDGFDNGAPLSDITPPRYADFYRRACAVARAAGLEEGEQKA
jgi:hypothetical protein